MFNTQKILSATRFATDVHRSQFRKGKDIPYITHPLTVGLILAGVSKDEDIICAGILHDTIEDCDPYGSITKIDIQEGFGVEVARMVNDVTEQDKSLPWEERKRLALEHVKHMQNDSILVKSADVLNNMTDQITDYKKEGDKMFLRFNASKEKQLLRYENLIHELKKAWPKNPLLADLEVNLEIFINSLKQKMPTSELPRFFDVDGTLVKVDLSPDGSVISGRTSTGGKFPPIIAAEDGKEITEEEFNRAVAALKYPLLS